MAVTCAGHGHGNCTNNVVSSFPCFSPLYAMYSASSFQHHEQKILRSDTSTQNSGTADIFVCSVHVGILVLCDGPLGQERTNFEVERRHNSQPQKCQELKGSLGG